MIIDWDPSPSINVNRRFYCVSCTDSGTEELISNRDIPTLYVKGILNKCGHFYFFCPGVLGSLACAHSELVNSETVNLNIIFKELLGAVISQMQHHYFHSKSQAQKTDFPASNGIRIHDQSVRASEIISCLFVDYTTPAIAVLRAAEN
jgi:hypothetical protein